MNDSDSSRNGRWTKMSGQEYFRFVFCSSWPEETNQRVKKKRFSTNRKYQFFIHPILYIRLKANHSYLSFSHTSHIHKYCHFSFPILLPPPPLPPTSEMTSCYVCIRAQGTLLPWLVFVLCFSSLVGIHIVHCVVSCFCYCHRFFDENCFYNCIWRTLFSNSMLNSGTKPIF